MTILTEIWNIFAIYECPQSKGVKKYKFKIKKENERCLEYLVEDLDHEDENIKFTIPLAFQVLLRYINMAGWCFKALLKIVIVIIDHCIW